VYVIIEVPADTAVTVPDDELIVATEFVEDDQEPPVKEEDSVGVAPMHIAVVPNKVPAEGTVVTVTVAVVETFAQPPVPVMV
jgi:hypothetical protein